MRITIRTLNNKYAELSKTKTDLSVDRKNERR